MYAYTESSTWFLGQSDSVSLLRRYRVTMTNGTYRQVYEVVASMEFRAMGFALTDANSPAGLAEETENNASEGLPPPAQYAVTDIKLLGGVEVGAREHAEFIESFGAPGACDDGGAS